MRLSRCIVGSGKQGNRWDEGRKPAVVCRVVVVQCRREARPCTVRALTVRTRVAPIVWGKTLGPACCLTDPTK